MHPFPHLPMNSNWLHTLIELFLTNLIKKKLILQKVSNFSSFPLYTPMYLSYFYINNNLSNVYNIYTISTDYTLLIKLEYYYMYLITYYPDEA